MSIDTYVVNRDKFEPEDQASGFQLCFPCCACKWRHGADYEEPCRTCDHNASAQDDDQ